MQGIPKNNFVIRAYNNQKVIVDETVAHQIAKRAGLIRIIDVDGNVTYHNPSSIANITQQVPPHQYKKMLEKLDIYAEDQRPLAMQQFMLESQNGN